MNKKIYHIIARIFLLLILISQISCLENTNEPEKYSYFESADIVAYLETHNNFINTNQESLILGVDDLAMMNNNSKIFDIRTIEEFKNGHLENAINVSLDDILDSINYADPNNVLTKVIVCENGQKSSYVASLLRLYGFSEVFVLEFGMAKWNSNFAHYWFDNTGESEYLLQYYRNASSKPSLTKVLPTIEIEDENLGTDLIIKERIKKLLSEESYSEIKTTIQELDDKYRFINRAYVNSFIICYGDEVLYNEITYLNKDALPEPILYGGHPQTSLLYLLNNDFKSSELLLTLPLDQTIYIYDYNGQFANSLAAYLKLIGYNVKAINLGSASMFYRFLMLKNNPNILLYEDVKDYPYVK